MLDFSSIAVSYLVHSTEDEAKLLQAVTISFDLSSEDFIIDELEGYYGNRIKMLKAHITGDRASAISKRILSGLDRSFKTSLVTELSKYLDEHDSLYLRLDRQELPQRFVPGEQEPIRLKLKPKNRKDRESIIRGFEELILS